MKKPNVLLIVADQLRGNLTNNLCEVIYNA